MGKQEPNSAAGNPTGHRDPSGQDPASKRARIAVVRQAVKNLFSEEPYAGNPHVRFCGGADLGNWVGLPDP